MDSFSCKYLWCLLASFPGQMARLPMWTGYEATHMHAQSRVYVVSLVPRPHPLTRRNGLVNEVEFLGLVHTFVTPNW